MDKTDACCPVSFSALAAIRCPLGLKAITVNHMDQNTVTLLSSLAEAGGLATFVWFLIKGLQSKIVN